MTPLISSGTTNGHLALWRAGMLATAACWALATAALAGAGAAKRNDERAARDETAQVRPYELQLFTLISQERERYGLAPLKLSQKLSQVARAHSRDMRDGGYLSHSSPVVSRSTPEARFRRAFGYDPYLLGENIARRAGEQWCLTPDRVEKTHQGLMGSPHHRDNILRPEFQQIGIGISVNESGHYWVTELFVRDCAPQAQASRTSSR